MNQDMNVTANNFHWTCSYQNEVEYKWLGGWIDVYTEPRFGLLEYQHSTFNHNGDPTSFQRNMVDRIGGAVVRRSNWRENYNRWTPELWSVFVAHLTAKHNEGQAHIRESAARNPDVDYSDLIHDLELPKPIYWSTETKRFEVEPFYLAAPVAVAT